MHGHDIGTPQRFGRAGSPHHGGAHDDGPLVVILAVTLAVILAVTLRLSVPYLFPRHFRPRHFRSAIDHRAARAAAEAGH